MIFQSSNLTHSSLLRMKITLWGEQHCAPVKHPTIKIRLTAQRSLLLVSGGSVGDGRRQRDSIRCSRTAADGDRLVCAIEQGDAVVCTLPVCFGLAALKRCVIKSQRAPSRLMHRNLPYMPVPLVQTWRPLTKVPPVMETRRGPKAAPWGTPAPTNQCQSYQRAQVLSN